MPSETLPNLGLKAFYNIGEGGWGADMSLNLLKLSVLTQGGVLDKYATEPGAPAAGTVILLDETNVANPNKVAVYHAAAWAYFTPLEGWLLFNRTMNYFEKFSGAAWGQLATGGGGSGSLPPGGVAGQALVKQSSSDGDADWETISGGGPYVGTPKSVAFLWDGTNVVILKQTGISSVTRKSVGRYRVNFSSPFADNYYVTVSGAKGAFDTGYSPAGFLMGNPDRQSIPDVSYCDVVVSDNGQSLLDPGPVSSPPNCPWVNYVFLPV